MGETCLKSTSAQSQPKNLLQDDFAYGSFCPPSNNPTYTYSYQAWYHKPGQVIIGGYKVDQLKAFSRQQKSIFIIPSGYALRLETYII